MVKYNTFLGIASIKIFATNVTMAENTTTGNIVILPEKFKSNSCFLQSQALSEYWKPLDNHLFLSIGADDGLNIRTNTALNKAVIADTFYLYPGYWWIA